jgi:selenide, water dikinase
LAQVLRPLQNIFAPADYPALLVGLSAPDDAAVYRLGDAQAIISTVDFFPPVVDDPFAFGAIAAANALSDVYAMGGQVLFAINLAAFPDNLELEILSEILRGGADRVRAAGAAIAGGHTIKDKEPKYGLAVTGLVDPARIIGKGGAQHGDALLLTKPLGVGVITTALKRDCAEKADVEAAIASMVSLNKAAAEAAQAINNDAANPSARYVHAMTDITGFGLVGHAHEMAHLSGARFVFNYADLPFLAGAARYAADYIFPGGAATNADYYQTWASFAPQFTDWQRLLAYDPETSGGLLMAVDPAKVDSLQAALHASGGQSWVIGHVEASHPEQAGQVQFN